MKHNSLNILTSYISTEMCLDNFRHVLYFNIKVIIILFQTAKEIYYHTDIYIFSLTRFFFKKRDIKCHEVKCKIFLIWAEHILFILHSYGIHILFI